MGFLWVALGALGLWELSRLYKSSQTSSAMPGMPPGAQPGSAVPPFEIPLPQTTPGTPAPAPGPMRPEDVIAREAAVLQPEAVELYVNGRNSTAMRFAAYEVEKDGFPQTVALLRKRAKFLDDANALGIQIGVDRYGVPVRQPGRPVQSSSEAPKIADQGLLVIIDQASPKPLPVSITPARALQLRTILLNARNAPK